MSKKNRIPRKLKKKIPEGVYCYTFTGKTVQKWNEEYKMFLPAYKTNPCPFYTAIQAKNKPEQDEIDKEYPEEWVGWCKYIKYEIDDQCKMCSIKSKLNKRFIK